MQMPIRTGDDPLLAMALDLCRRVGLTVSPESVVQWDGLGIQQLNRLTDMELTRFCEILTGRLTQRES